MAKLPATIFMVAIFAFTLTACTITLTNTVTSSSISGTVVDADSYTAAGLAYVNVTLTSITDPTYTATATTDSSGNYTFIGLDSSKSPYTLSSSLSGYFIPTVRVNQNGYNIVMDDIPAVQLSTSNIGGLSFLTVYNNQAAHIDSYLSFPDSDQSSTEPSFTTPYADPLSDLRAEVYYASPVFLSGTNSSSATAFLNTTVNSNNTSGASSLTLRSIPFTYGSYPGNTTNYPLTMSSPDVNGLSSAFKSSFGSDAVYFRYMGAAELYLNATLGTLTSSPGATTNPNLTVYCVQTTGTSSNPSATLLGSFTLPSSYSLKSVSLIRVNMFLYYDSTQGTTGAALQLVPDEKVISQGPASGVGSLPFKALAGSSSPILGVILPTRRS
ncbi:MAG: carboxypeptidase regulatory-like domain-containing protein [Spirochaetales bacterium]|nr:carboxypeptidase regulatory-like domain-containing protein [Spirochaetales bacterium]